MRSSELISGSGETGVFTSRSEWNSGPPWAPGLFHLPKRAPPREAEAVERPDLGQALQLVAMQRHTIDEVLERHETLDAWRSATTLLPRCLPQAGHVHEPEPNGAIFLE